MHQRDLFCIAVNSFILCLAGFLIWLIDERYCASRLNAQKHVRFPLEVLLEGHALW